MEVIMNRIEAESIISRYYREDWPSTYLGHCWKYIKHNRSIELTPGVRIICEEVDGATEYNIYKMIGD